MDEAEILSRLKVATGPDRELDTRIWCASFPDEKTLLFPGRIRPSEPPIWGTLRDISLEGWSDWEGLAMHVRAEHLTGSLDAAIALVERMLPGWAWTAERHFEEASSLICARWEPGVRERSFRAYAPTPPLAVLIALFMALPPHPENA